MKAQNKPEVDPAIKGVLSILSCMDDSEYARTLGRTLRFGFMIHKTVKEADVEEGRKVFWHPGNILI